MVRGWKPLPQFFLIIISFDIKTSVGAASCRDGHGEQTKLLAGCFDKPFIQRHDLTVQLMGQP